jgi:hypothetical protein
MKNVLYGAASAALRLIERVRPAVTTLLILSLFGIAAEGFLFVHKSRPGLQFVMDCHVNRACLPSKILATTGSIAAASGQSYKASVQMEKMGEGGVAFLAMLNQKTPPVLDQTRATIASAGSLLEDLKAQTHDLLGSAKALTDAAKKDLDSVTGKLGADLDALKPVMDNLSALEKDLDAQIKTGGPKVQADLDAIQSLLAHVDELLAGQEIKTALTNTAKTSAAIYESAESVRIALEPLRKKISLLKMVITKVIEIAGQAVGTAIGKHW